jgi:RNA polymerase sigma-70 factor (ECF subfamily)
MASVSRETGSARVADQIELDDSQLLRRISLMEQDALEALYSRYSSPIYSLAMMMLKQPALAEEVTQDIFLNVWLKAGSYNPDRGAPKSWIMSVAHHKIIDAIRARRRTVAVGSSDEYDALDYFPSSEASTEEQVEQNLDRERILKALQGLPDSQREVIMLAYFQGYSQSEMADRLKQPLGTVKTRVRLAMQKLRTILDDDE